MYLSLGFRRRSITAIMAVIAAVALMYPMRIVILRDVGIFLVVRDQLSPSDIIFVLNGDPNTRPFEAARLWRAGFSPRVVIARAADSALSRAGVVPNTTDLCISALEHSDVPPSYISQITSARGVTSTFDEARLLRDFVIENGIRRVIVVTSTFHTRRARWIISKELRGTPASLLMWPVGDPKYDEGNWWREEDGLIAVQNEYLKLLYYAVRH